MLSEYSWEYYKSRSEVGKAVTALINRKNYYTQSEYDKSIRNNIGLSEEINENNLIFRDLAEESIDNPLSVLPYISRAAEKAGRRNRADERTLRALQDRHGRISRRIYELASCYWFDDAHKPGSELSSCTTAILRFFLAESGVCIKATRVYPGLISMIERRSNAHAINPNSHYKWVKEKILGSACIDPKILEKKKGLLSIEELLVNPRTEVFTCGLTNTEYDIIRTDTPYRPGDPEIDYPGEARICNPDSLDDGMKKWRIENEPWRIEYDKTINSLIAERSSYSLFLVAKPPLNSRI